MDSETKNYSFVVTICHIYIPGTLLFLQAKHLVLCSMCGYICYSHQLFPVHARSTSIPPLSTPMSSLLWILFVHKYSCVCDKEINMQELAQWKHLCSSQRTNCYRDLFLFIEFILGLIRLILRK